MDFDIHNNVIAPQRRSVFSIKMTGRAATKTERRCRVSQEITTTVGQPFRFGCGSAALGESVAIARTNYRLFPHFQEKSTKASRTCVKAGLPRRSRCGESGSNRVKLRPVVNLTNKSMQML
jgi:hypothetical protein